MSPLWTLVTCSTLLLEWMDSEKKLYKVLVPIWAINTLFWIKKVFSQKYSPLWPLFTKNPLLSRKISNQNPWSGFHEQVYVEVLGLILGKTAHRSFSKIFSIATFFTFGTLLYCRLKKLLKVKILTILKKFFFLILFYFAFFKIWIYSMQGWTATQGSTTTIKSPHVITYMCQIFGIRDIRGQIPKSTYQALYLLPSDFP